MKSENPLQERHGLELRNRAALLLLLLLLHSRAPALEE
jgi:hypothetical protein